MKIYFARPISLYGTKQDIRDIETLKTFGFEVIDPNTENLQERYNTAGMIVFEEVVAKCDCLAFRSFQDGKIGAGMVKEINIARQLNKPIIELPTITSHRELSVDDTRTYLQLLGYR